jgi:acyl-CoA thioesterase
VSEERDDSPPFWLKEQLGFRVERAEGTARVLIDCDERHFNPNGVVHGAVVFALVDTGMGAATMSLVGEGAACATIEIQLRYLSPVFAGPLCAEVRVVKAGKRIVHLAADVFGAPARLVATASGSFAIIPAPAPR